MSLVSSPKASFFFAGFDTNPLLAPETLKLKPENGPKSACSILKMGLKSLSWAGEFFFCGKRGQQKNLSVRRQFLFAKKGSQNLAPQSAAIFGL